MKMEGSPVLPTMVSCPVKSPGHIAATASARKRTSARAPAAGGGRLG
jgi:hypothetical protein